MSCVIYHNGISMYITQGNKFEKIEVINKNVLKYIVIVFMLLDHLSYLFPLDNPIVQFIGFISRLTAPTMALSIAEGYRYTKNLKKYMKRLFIFSLISYIPFVLFRTESFFPIQLFSGSSVPVFYEEPGAIVIEPHIFIQNINSTLVIHENSVIFTLFLGLCTIYLWDKIEISKYLKILITLVILWIASFCNWQYYLIFLCLIFYFFRDNPKKMWISFIIIGLLYTFSVRLFANHFMLNFTAEFVLFRTGIFMVPFFFLLYNGKSGSKSSFNKWFFYIFYPLHLFIIGIIRLFI